MNEEILKVIAGSEKSYEEILSFIQGKTDTDSSIVGNDGRREYRYIIQP